MTELLEKAIEAARKLAPAEQDEIARAILELAGSRDLGLVPLSEDELRAVARSKDAAARREFATDEQVRAVWSKRGL
jgi:hypothetical protein